MDVMLDPGECDPEAELRGLPDLLKSSQVVSSRYPKLLTLTLCLHMGRIEEYWPCSSEDDSNEISAELDAFLMCIVRNTSISEISIQIQWTKTLKWDVRAYYEDYVEGMFPTLSKSNKLRFRDVAREL